MASIAKTNSPGRLAVRLAIYFAILFGVLISVVQMRPEVIRFLPIGGTDAIHGAEIVEIKDFLSSVSSDGDAESQPAITAEAAKDRLGRLTLFVVAHLAGTILIMLPITWTYKAVRHESGFNKNFVRSLMILPICATTVVLLVQDSLALAFGLAALVAAVRFRVALDEAMDGIFIFAAVCVGLAAGIGYLGVGAMMAIFFCFSNVVLWALDYGQNPLDEARRQKKQAKLQRPPDTPASS